MNTYHPRVFGARLLIASLIGLAAMRGAHACDCNIAADRAAFPVQCGITGNTVSGTQSQGQGQSQTNKVSNSNAIKTNVSLQTGASTNNAQGGSAAVGNVASTSTAAGGEAGAVATAGGGGSATQDSHDVTSYAASRIPVSTAIAGVGMTTAGCRYAQGIGVQGMSVGTSIGLSFKDRTCVRAALAEGFYARGQWNAGDRIECTIAEVHDALGSDCIAILGELRSDEGRAYIPPPAQDAVTHAELSAALTRAFTRSVAK